jgi:hypothetical protein
MLSSSNQILVAFTKELVPGILNLTPPMKHDFAQFAQGPRVETVIVGYHDIRQEPKLGIDTILADMDVHRLARVTLVREEVEAEALVTENDGHSGLL